MAKKGVCASCLEFDIDKVVKSKESLKPTWLEENDFVKTFIENHNMKLKIPRNSDVEMKLDLGARFSEKRLLYWAAESCSKMSPIIKDAKKAYGSFENSGVVKVNKEGKVVFRFNCPQVYKAKRSNESKLSTYFRHMHFVVEKDNKWDPQIYTKIVICKYDYNTFIEKYNNGMNVIINALPSEYFAKDHIPNSYNLFNKTVKRMSTEQLLEWFGEVVRIHYPKLHQYVKNKKIELYEIPIVTYCAHEKCNASELTIKQLMKKGFVNINEYSAGMKEYRMKRPYD